MAPNRAPARLPATSGALDPEVGQLFAQLRRVLAIEADGLARLLFTSVETIVALEAGDIDSLPPWLETERVVRAYTGLAGIDPEPMLKRIRSRLDQPAAVRPGKAPASRAMVPVESRSKPSAAPKRPAASAGAQGAAAQAAQAAQAVRRWLGDPRSRRRTIIVSSVGILAAAFLAAGQLVSAMPAPMQRAIGSLMDRMVWGASTMPDGMRLIDPADPRSRRTDKLHTPRH